MDFGFIKQYIGLPARIYVLFLARIIAAMGAFVFAFLTLFMSSKLGYSEVKISRYLLLLAIITMVAALIGGKLADHFSRKLTYVGLMTTGELCFMISGFMIDSPYVIIVIFTGVFFVNAASPVISAMMMDFTTPENRRESMSLVYLGFNLGYAVGPMIAGFLFANYMPWIFWGNAIINTISVLLILILIKDETPVDDGVDSPEPVTEEVSNRGLLRQLLHDPILIIVAGLGISFSFCYSQIGYILPLDMEDYFGIEVGSHSYGIVWSINGLMVFLLTPLCVYALKKFHPVFNLAVAGLLYTVGFAGYAFTHNLILMYLLVVVWTAGESVYSSNTGVFIASHAPACFRARYQAIYDIIQSTGRAVGPMLMGAFLMNHSISQGWILCGCLCIFSCICYFTLHFTGHE